MSSADAPPAVDRRRRRREEILDAAQRAFLERGFHSTGIADIANELQIGHGTVYRYFKNKQDIASAVLDSVIERLAAVGLAENPEASDDLPQYRAQVRRILQGLLKLTTEHPRILTFLRRQGLVIDPERLTTFHRSFATFTARFLVNGVRKGFLRDDLDVDATAEILVTIIFEGATRALSDGDPDKAQRWVESGMALMFDGIAAPDGAG